jgi:hypothetical protein
LATFIDDRHIYIDERGAGICAIIDVLAEYLKWYPNDADLEKMAIKVVKCSNKSI